MRLWHQDLIPFLPRQQLLGQHRECCALRGKGWGKKHSTVNYVFTHAYERLVAYHMLVLEEMRKRGYKPDIMWFVFTYRGKQLTHKRDTSITLVYLHLCSKTYFLPLLQEVSPTIYPEHDDSYLKECLDNLASKGVTLTIPNPIVRKKRCNNE